MNRQKFASQYAKMFARELSAHWGRDEAEMYQRFYDKCLELVSSPEFDEYAKHNISIESACFFVTASLVCRELGCSFEETMEILHNISWPIRRRYRSILNALERLPFGYELFAFFVDRFNQLYGDDIGFDFRRKEKDKFEYQISRCIYIEIFEHYGIREYYKALCDSDVDVLGGACKHAKFIRYSDMATSPVCHDAVVRVKK